MKKKIIAIILIFVMNFHKTDGQLQYFIEENNNEMVKQKYKRLKVPEALAYIAERNGIKKNHPFSSWSYVYECDDNTLIVENTKEKKFVLYYDGKKFYEGIEYSRRLIDNHPLSSEKEQIIILDIENNISSLLDELFSELNIKSSGKLNDIDIKEFDKKLKLYGYEKAYFNLMLSLIVFCGEYIREKRGGHWDIGADPLGRMEPIYKDREGQEYSFLINIVLFRQFERNFFNITSLIEGALEPPIFKVVPNPSLRNPNEQ